MASPWWRKGRRAPAKSRRCALRVTSKAHCVPGDQQARHPVAVALRWPCCEVDWCCVRAIGSTAVSRRRFLSRERAPASAMLQRTPTRRGLRPSSGLHRMCGPVHAPRIRRRAAQADAGDPYEVRPLPTGHLRVHQHYTLHKLRDRLHRALADLQRDVAGERAQAQALLT